MITIIFLLLAAPLRAAEPLPLPGMPGAAVVVSSAAVTAPAAASAAPAANASVIPLMPPKVPARPKGTLDTAADVARDLAVRVEYFEHGQSYYRAYTKGSHSPEENKAFVQFLEDYENELGIAKRVHTLLGVWLEKKSAIKD